MYYILDGETFENKADMLLMWQLQRILKRQNWQRQEKYI